MFVDEVDILVEAGHGGAGAMSFRREKFVPRGGPDGGDGGKGGSVYAVASPHINTLIAFRFNREFRAKRGGHGEGSNRTGKDAQDVELEVPIGTLIYQKPDDPAERPGERALRQLDQPRAAAFRRGAARGNEAPSASSETPRGRRPRRLSERW
jgi:GTP-binding protein